MFFSRSQLKISQKNFTNKVPSNTFVIKEIKYCCKYCLQNLLKLRHTPRPRDEKSIVYLLPLRVNKYRTLSSKLYHLFVCTQLELFISSENVTNIPQQFCHLLQIMRRRSALKRKKIWSEETILLDDKMALLPGSDPLPMILIENVMAEIFFSQKEIENI